MWGFPLWVGWWWGLRWIIVVLGYPKNGMDALYMRLVQKIIVARFGRDHLLFVDPLWKAFEAVPWYIECRIPWWQVLKGEASASWFHAPTSGHTNCPDLRQPEAGQAWLWVLGVTRGYWFLNPPPLILFHHCELCQAAGLTMPSNQIAATTTGRALTA